ncbi:hypothetical protein G6F40_016079 [Rhizopus arrhizus]|nr:hypothetical protein G6F40_016079 [Rhizopus arrhizus]
MTMRKSPRVTLVMGSVSSTSTGLTSMFTRPSTSAAISADPKLATAMPGNSRPDPGAASSASHPASSGAGGRPSRPGAWAARRLRRTCTLRCA